MNPDRMKKAMRWLVPLLGVAAVIALFVALRPGDGPASRSSASPGDDPAGLTTTPAPSPSEIGDAPPEAPSASPSEERQPPSIVLVVRQGEVEGPRVLEVRQGDQVVIEVSADIADEVHVHGYDVSAEVSPERRARLVFVADAPGVYEVELESAALPLFELRVVP